MSSSEWAKAISPSVLFVGPIEDKGGIGSVIAIYKNYFTESKYISTYPSEFKSARLVEFIKGLLSITKIMLIDKSLKIVHIHCASNGSFLRKSIVVMLSKTFGKKIILHMHGGGFKNFYQKNDLLKYYIRFIMNRCTYVICLSDEWKEFYCQTIKIKNVIAINNPVKIKNIIHIKKPEKEIKILFLGKLCEEKGIFQLIEYFKSSDIASNKRFKLIICGLGESEKLYKMISDPILHDLIEYRGWVEGSEKENLINESDIYILPSHFEGLPMSILESMSAGKPIIATRVGGIPSIVLEKKNGWLMDVGAFDQLNRILTEIMDSPELLIKYGKQSREYALSYHPDTVINKLKPMYENCI